MKMSTAVCSQQSASRRPTDRALLAVSLLAVSLLAVSLLAVSPLAVSLLAAAAAAETVAPAVLVSMSATTLARHTSREAADSSGVYICKSVVSYLRHGNYICKSEGIYLTYEHRSKIPVEFTFVNQ
jgi:hypothetical protein